MAKEIYDEIGVDTDAATETLKKIPISMHCWQGDDVLGFLFRDNALSGGIRTTGNYPGRAATVEQLRADLDVAFSLIPGKTRLNLHSIYADTDEKVDLCDLAPRHFASWIDYAKERGIGLDYFDASINRVAAWVIGTRNMQKALLRALLEPVEAWKKLENEGDYTARLALTEEHKTLPMGAVWGYYCESMGAPVRDEWLETVRKYERIRKRSAGKPLMDAHIYPLKLSYLAKTALWGGNKLKEEYGKASEHEKLSETWELSVRENDTCLIENGPAAGMLLSDYFADYGNSLVGKRYDGSRFPLLIKFIDARDCLSVQVHPDDAYAFANEKDPGKTEMWYVVEAEEGAELIYGLKNGVTKEDFVAAVDAGDYNSVMGRVPVKAGETYFIPSGMLHAIGAGLLIAEIQQNSDLTYRVYDFDRRGADGKLRPLHVDKAKAVTRPFTEEEIRVVRYSRGVSADEGVLADCPYFRVTRCGEQDHDLCVTEESFMHLLCVKGEGYITFDREKYPIAKGDSYFLPAGMGDVSLSGDVTLLVSSAYFD